MSGRSPVESPALYLASVSSQPTWFTSDTFTADWELFNPSTSCWSTVSLARSIQCHMVISTGFDAFFNAPSGQVVLLAATAGDAGRAPGAPTASAATIVRRTSRVIGSSSLHRSCSEPAHELLLEEEEQDHEWDHRDHSTCEHDVQLVDARLLELVQTDLHGPQLVILGDEQWPEVLVPRREEREHGECGDCGAGQRDRHPPEEPPVAVAVECRGVAQFVRQREERLPHQERAEAGREERHCETGVGVVPTEVADGRHVGDDRDL